VNEKIRRKICGKLFPAFTCAESRTRPNPSSPEVP
jgi:hypothetical protein